MIGVLVLAALVAGGVWARAHRKEIVGLVLALLIQRADEQIDQAYRQARRDMNDAADQSWRNLAG